jgi:hypothetical protein
MNLFKKYLLTITATLAVMVFLSGSLKAGERLSLSKDDSTQYQPKRGKIIAIGLGSAYAGSIGLLSEAWYKDYPKSSFHFFNDNKEWQQMDKLGHMGSAYYLGRWCSGLFRWTGTSSEKAAWLGAGSGYLYLLTVEVLDGFSSNWGFSSGDLIANTAGSALFLAQEIGWHDQRITFKMSYHESGLAKYRTNTLGENFPERVLKDYNGQTYWLSANIHSFLPSESKFPSWLNIAFGYGADGMIGANVNEMQYNGKEVPQFERVRQFYLAPDIDLTKIKTKSKFMRSAFRLFGFIKFPAPALEFRSNGKWILHGFYF